MVSISKSDVEKLNFSFEISKVNYKLDTDEAEILLWLAVTYPSISGQDIERAGFTITVKRSARIKEGVRQKQAELNKALDKIKSRIKTLLELQDSVEVNLRSIFDELFVISRKGIVPEAEEVFVEEESWA